MRRNLIVALVTIVSLTTLACDSPSPGPPSVSSQDPGPKLSQYSGEQKEAENKLVALNNRKEGLDNKLQEWTRLGEPAQGEPVLSDQRSQRGEEIKSESEALEEEARQLLARPHLAEYAGAPDKLDEIVKFAQQARKTVEDQK